MGLEPFPARASPLHSPASGPSEGRAPSHPVRRAMGWVLAFGIAIAPALLLLARPPGPPAAAATPDTPASPSPKTTTVVETSDNGYYVVVDEAGNEVGAASAIGPVTRTDDFGVMVQGRAAAGIITVSVTLENRTPAAVAFPGGLSVSVPITRDGTAWRTLRIDDPAVTELAPGASLSCSATTEAEGPGQYVFAASVETQRLAEPGA